MRAVEQDTKLYNCPRPLVALSATTAVHFLFGLGLKS